MSEKAYVGELYGAFNPDGVSERAYGWWRGDGPTLVWANLIWCFVIGAWTAFWMVSKSSLKQKIEVKQQTC